MSRHSPTPLPADWDDSRRHLEDELRCIVADAKHYQVQTCQLLAALREIRETTSDHRAADIARSAIARAEAP